MKQIWQPAKDSLSCVRVESPISLSSLDSRSGTDMRATKHVLALPASLVTIALLAACAGEIPMPTTPTAARVQGGVAFNATSARKHIPNAKKYRDKGAKPAKGRAGSATLEVRALLGNTGVVKLEASTGSLEAGTNPGTIVKVEVRIRARKGPPLTYTKLSGDGYWTTTLLGLAPGDLIEVQAYIRGIDPKRTDVVTVVTSVKRGPDVAVMSVTGPDQWPPNMAVSFSASVAELNGGIGARADCVLSVDDAVVDYASGIWVDAGDNVNCLFTYAFAAVGVHNVRVFLANVIPGDGNTANNSASTSITIVAPVLDGTNVPSGNLYARERDLTQRYREYDSDGPVPFEKINDTKYAMSFVFVRAQEQIELQGLQRVDLAIDVDGVRVYTGTLPLETDRGDDGNWDDNIHFSRCWHLVDSGNNADVCTSGSRDPENYHTSTVYEIQRQSGTVTYFADGLDCTASGCGTYLSNSMDVYGTGITLPLGNSVRLVTSVVDGLLQSHTVDKTLTMFDDVAAPGPQSGPSWCPPYADRNGQPCYEWSYLTIGRNRLGNLTWP